MIAKQTFDINSEIKTCCRVTRTDSQRVLSRGAQENMTSAAVIL